MSTASPPPPPMAPSAGPMSSRQFSEISLAELPEVLAVARDSLDPSVDEERWLRILDAVSEMKREREAERVAWEEKLDAVATTLETLKDTDPRASWRTPSAHSKQLALHNQRKLELAKQIDKLEAAISRAETDVRECREGLRELGSRGDALDTGDGYGDGEDDGESGGKNSLALTMFRQLGFQPTSAPSSSSGMTIFARSDAKGKVTPFSDRAQDEGSNDADADAAIAQRAIIANAMWDAVE